MQCLPRRQSVFNLQLRICSFYKKIQDLEPFSSVFPATVFLYVANSPLVPHPVSGERRDKLR
jgi:hypothetical protein